MNELTIQLAAALRPRAQTYGRAVLVIDGDCAAGKTTLAAQVSAEIDCSVFHMDDFFLSQTLRTEARLHEAGGNIHYERFFEQVLLPLRKNQPVTYGAYSCADGQTREISVTPKPIVIIEGSYALHPRFLDTYRALNALMVFLRIAPDEQIKRITRRNGEAMLRRFQEEWIPMEKRYQTAFAPDWPDVRFIDG